MIRQPTEAVGSAKALSDDGSFTKVINPQLAEELANIERHRLRLLREARVAEADALHAPDFELVHPSGGVWTKDQYLGGIASGHISYRRFDVTSDIEVMADGGLAVLRYRSAIDIAVTGQEAGPLECWHLDCYRRDAGGGPWRVRWSQATSIVRRATD